MLLVVGFIAFALFAFVGDPVNIMLGTSYTEADRVRMTHELGLDQPFLVQYVKYIWAVLHGEFGVSYRLARPVSTLIAERLPATAELSLAAALFALLVGVPAGVYTGIYRNSMLSRAFMVLSLVGVSLPTFLIGISADPRLQRGSGLAAVLWAGHGGASGWVDDRIADGVRA